MTLERRGEEIKDSETERAKRITKKLKAIMRDPDLASELLPAMEDVILPGMVGMEVITQSQADSVLAVADETINSLLTPEQKAEVDKELERQRWAEKHRRTGHVPDFVSVRL